MIVVDAGGGADHVIARLGGLRPTLDLLDALARLRLAAARVGIDLRYREPCPTLRAVIELAGFEHVLLLDEHGGHDGRGERPGRRAPDQLSGW